MTESLISLADSLPRASPGHLSTGPDAAWNPSCTGTIPIRIAANGQWYHEEQLIRRPALVRLFASILRREEDGEFYLVTPVEKLRIQVDEYPFVAVLVEVDEVGAQPVLRFTLNTGDHVAAGPAHRLWVEERQGAPLPLLEVRPGLHARLARSVFYDLVERASLLQGEDGEVIALSSQGEVFVLGPAV
jgi:hypothetical protein